MQDRTAHSNAVPALVVVYNHRYDKNIETLEEIYYPRFSHIYHLMPFYNGDRPNVIPVYENSYYFQGYIAQGLLKYLEPGYSHYLFVADDLILNPIINEHNYRDHFQLSHSASFLPGFISLHKAKSWWPRVREALAYRPDRAGVEVMKELPPYGDALRAFRTVGLEIRPPRFEQLFPAPEGPREYSRQLFLRLKHYLTRTSYALPYPVVGSYSDLVVVSAQCIRQFCHYCGVFAATDLFVELAVPTALVLSTTEIVTENDLALRGKALWTNEDQTELLRFNNQLRNLLSEFPSSYLYLHPVKLSRWNTAL